MANLKILRRRIQSVRSTQKITSAMKMVAASKLRRAQEQAEAARPYAERMERMVGALAASTRGREGVSPLLSGTGRDQVHLLIPITADRGLCGSFNSAIIRATQRDIRRLEAEGKTVKLLCVGRKARDALRRDHGDKIVETFQDLQRPALDFAKADGVAQRIMELFEEGAFDVASVVYNRFRSAISQIVTHQQLIPFTPPEAEESDDTADGSEGGAQTASGAVYEFEPAEEDILAALLPDNMAVQVYRGLLESAASEHGARMTAMDNATRNAGEMIDRLALVYNRTRQAAITTELIEIISGAEAI
ncbi:MAG: F0F1 ATP synthase subunit gamma [Alphaproteobacteria bacterium]